MLRTIYGGIVQILSRMFLHSCKFSTIAGPGSRSMTSWTDQEWVTNQGPSQAHWFQKTHPLQTSFAGTLTDWNMLFHQ